MLFPKITDPNTPHLALAHRILQRPPTTQPLALPTIRTMQQKQVHVPQPTNLYTLFHTPPHLVITPITGQFGRVMHVISLHGRVGGEVGGDGFADGGFVVVHLRGVDGAVAGGQGVGGGCGGFGGGHEVDA